METDPAKLLRDAVEHEDVDQARSLLDEGTDPDARDASNSTPLHFAAKVGNLDVVELLLEYGADPNAREEAGSISLHHAAQNGHDRLVQLLLDYRADTEAKDESGSTPLHIAAKGKNVLTVKLLLDSGADLEAKDNTESTPRFYANQEDIALLLNHEKVAIPRQASLNKYKLAVFSIHDLRLALTGLSRHKIGHHFLL